MAERTQEKRLHQDTAIGRKQMSAEKIGEYLRRERELRGITLEEISEGTKISKRLLEYMETGRWDDLPGEVFARGFLKSYAEFIGISHEEILLRYEEEKLHETSEQDMHEGISGKNRYMKNVLFMLGILAMASAIGYFSYRVFTNDQGVGLSTQSGRNVLPASTHAKAPVTEQHRDTVKQKPSAPHGEAH